ncbi:hypothetical protein Cantr_04584 [Candida viswanathii]|uniref:Autophagy-related protein 33 n=1 Tax=Candida viswanathii TaxID=5486 RepID=A0A367XNX9_9ASCO|nr:hypothetical protein Cantr_04584 [Candida viswanathii]
MAGTCITTIKLLGVGSLGLLTSSIIYQSLSNLPELIHQFNAQFNSSSIDYFNKKLENLKQNIFNNRLINGVLAALTTGLFTVAFKYSPVHEKHPYLIYASIGAPLSLIGLYYNNWNYEQKILSKKTVDTTAKAEVEKPGKQPVEDDEAAHDGEEPEVISKVTSADSLLGKSYVHLSDESGLSTPNSSQPSTPKVQPKEDTEEDHIEKSAEEIAVDKEVENILIKKEIVQDLKNIESGYVLGSYISGVSLLIASIGLFGDYYLL